MADDALASARAAWAGHAWKVDTTFELLAVAAYTEWEALSHRAVIITLARDTNVMAADKGLKLPHVVGEDLAEAILTGMRFLNFGGVEGLLKKGWLVNYALTNLTPPEKQVAADLRLIRNYIAHRNRESEAKYLVVLKRLSNAVVPVTPGALLSGPPPAAPAPGTGGAPALAAPPASLFHSFLAALSNAATRVIT
ncbi:MAG: hypothetical protein ACREJ3_05270 [Polyangiaceae bacterium]